MLLTTSKETLLANYLIDRISDHRYIILTKLLYCCNSVKPTGTRMTKDTTDQSEAKPSEETESTEISEDSTVTSGEDTEFETEANSADEPPQDEPVTAESNTQASRQKGSDEQFCSSCGETIKKEAEICPECGVRQKASSNDFELQEKKKVANKDITTVMLVSFLLTPVGYWMVGKTLLAVVNFVTLNYFLLGWLIVPFHTRKIIKDTRAELAAQGEY